MTNKKKKINLLLEYDTLSFLFALIPSLAIVLSIHNRQIPQLIISRYETTPTFIFWISIILGGLVLLFFYFLFFLHLFRTIHGLISFLFLPQWFSFHQYKYSPDEYRQFLKRCIKWSQKMSPSISKYEKNKYNSPLAMIQYKEKKIAHKRYSSFRAYARKELKKQEIE